MKTSNRHKPNADISGERGSRRVAAQWWKSDCGTMHRDGDHFVGGLARTKVCKSVEVARQKLSASQIGDRIRCGFIVWTRTN